MSRLKKIVAFVIITILISSCKEKASHFTVQNTIDLERTFETVELTKAFLNVKDLSKVGILDIKSQELQVSQTVDNDGDGVMDVLLFQPQIAAFSKNTYKIVSNTEAKSLKAPELCYSRFVPERTDDYTWENDKVAFRVYGPTAQKMIQDNIPGGTLSSGVDAWLKKVEYPIINKWYKKYTDGTGSYHEDTGDGLDNFHVGVSRGVGGIAVKMDSTYYYSKNYTKWRTIATGPIRTSFYLEYEDWEAAGNSIKESKIISLDLGNNLSKFEIYLKGVDQISAGLTLHEKDGKVTSNLEKGWVSYWQPHAESELGTAIISSKNTFKGFEKYDIDAKDLSNAYAHLNVINGKVIYYAGFGWKESGQFKSKQEWENYLNMFSDKLENPLLIEIIK